MALQVEPRGHPTMVFESDWTWYASRSPFRPMSTFSCLAKRQCSFSFPLTHRSSQPPENNTDDCSNAGRRVSDRQLLISSKPRIRRWIVQPDHDENGEYHDKTSTRTPKEPSMPQAASKAYRGRQRIPGPCAAPVRQAVSRVEVECSTDDILRRNREWEHCQNASSFECPLARDYVFTARFLPMPTLSSARVT